MRFLKNRECINGENHTTQGDCRAVVPVYIFGTRTAQVGRHTAHFEVPFQRALIMISKHEKSMNFEGRRPETFIAFECLCTMIITRNKFLKWLFK